ncbi:MAG: IS1 family transposase [Phormidesmis sp. CAN_BIN44]|nr:IS1 family transposase [Phormidesmis sp. CAN_BIN44]
MAFSRLNADSYFSLTRLTRKTICFSKSIQMHNIVLCLFLNRLEFGRSV